MLRLHTFGSCFLERDGVRLEALSGQRKGLALLALLACAGERGVSRETLLAYLWPESDEKRARISLKQLVHSLRQQLRPPELLLTSTTFRLSPDHMTSDVAEFRGAVHREDHGVAVELYVGPFLHGFYLKDGGDFEHWVSSERASLAHTHARALESVAERASAGGDARLAVECWRRATNAEPLSAHAATGLMRALDAAGERAAALQHARVYQLLVREEVGGGADASVTELVARLQRSEPAMVPSTTERTPTPAGSSAVTSHATPASPNVAAHTETEASPMDASVAVLPFANTSRDAEDEHFSDGLTDELIGALGKVRQLKVAGRTSTFALKGKGLGLRAIADALGVRTILEGSVRRAGGRLKVVAQLVDSRDERVLWAETYDRELKDVFAVQEEIARAIVDALRVQLGDDEPRARSETADLIAYDLYLKGRYFLNRGTGGDRTRAVGYFEQAVARDPTSALAYAGLADAHLVVAIFSNRPPRDDLLQAKAAAATALALDSTLADAHTTLASVLMAFDWNWPAAEREFQRAIALDPGYALGHHRYGLYLLYQGRLTEAQSVLERAVALDPLYASVSMNLARLHVRAHRPDQAIPLLRTALELSPGLALAHEQLGHAYMQQGRQRAAIVAFQRAATLSGSRGSAQLAYALAAMGKRTEAEEILRQMLDPSQREFIPPVAVAMAYVGLGDADAAFRWLNRGFVEHAAFMDGLKATPAFDPLHRDARWAHLLRRMGLEP